MAIFVMIVHFSPFKTIDPLLHFLSIHGFTRVSVPFFILSTGYLISEDGKIGNSRRNKSLKKLISLYGFWTIIYLPLIIAQVVYSPHNSQWWVSFIRNLFFEGSFIHLWYLLATIIGLVIITLLTNKLSSPHSPQKFILRAFLRRLSTLFLRLVDKAQQYSLMIQMDAHNLMMDVIFLLLIKMKS